jgi:hypothetical protein
LGCWLAGWLACFLLPSSLIKWKQYRYLLEREREERRRDKKKKKKGGKNQITKEIGRRYTHTQTSSLVLCADQPTSFLFLGSLTWWGDDVIVCLVVVPPIAPFFLSLFSCVFFPFG